MAKFSAAFALALMVYLFGFFAANSSVLTDPPEYDGEASATVTTPASERPITSLRDINNAFVDLAESSSPAVVTVFSERTVRVQQRNPFDMFDEFFGRRPQREAPEREFQQRGQGSGVIVSSDGLILTNHHVINNAETITIRLQDRTTLEAEVIGSDASTDVAVLKVNAVNMPYLNMGNSDDLNVGEWVIAIGSPLSESLAHTVTSGIVSAKGRSNINLVDFEDFIQTDAAINPGNSGGPLINLDGELIGINTAIASRSGGFQGIGFAIPINMAQNVMESLINEGRVVRGYLGVNAQTVDELMARGLGLEPNRGVIITQIEDDSPAAASDLQQDDVVLELNGTTIRDSRQFRNLVASRSPGSTIRLLVQRDGSTKTIEIRLGERPDDQMTESEEESIRDRFGFSVNEFTRERAERYRISPQLQGVIVTEIDQQSPPFRQGLREGHLITAVNRVPVTNPREFAEVMSNLQEGDVASLVVIQRNQRFIINFEVR